eukprot:scaffold24143_cov146-Isochrysis_galbana.AAC.5
MPCAPVHPPVRPPPSLPRAHTMHVQRRFNAHTVHVQRRFNAIRSTRVRALAASWAVVSLFPLSLQSSAGR